MSMSFTIKRFVSLVLVFVFILSTKAQADLYGFECITNTSAGDAAIGEAQLFVDVTDPGGGQVLFTFSNTGPEASSITDVYFEDGTLLGIADIIDDPSPSPNPVDFEEGAAPGNLPGSDFTTSVYFFSADSESPQLMQNGVNPGESLGILFDLRSRYVFDDVITAINTGFTDPDPTISDKDGNIIHVGTTLRIGIHVQGFEDGGSESFVMTPEPGSLLLGSIGIGMVIARCRKRKPLIES